MKGGIRLYQKICFLVLFFCYKESKKAELLTWYEMDDYDNDGEWDTLNIERYVSEEKTESFYQLDLSACGHLEIGPFLNTGIFIQCVDLTDDGVDEVIVNSQYAFLSRIQVKSQFIVKKRKNTNN